MEYFYPKPGTFVAISKEESTEVNLNLTSFAGELSHEDQQTFLKLWMKSKKGIPAFTTIDSDGNTPEYAAVVSEPDEWLVELW